MSDLKSALLVIDMQVGPLYETYKKEETLAKVMDIIAKAEEKQIPIFYIQHEEQAGGFLERGTPFWQFIDGVAPRSSDCIINKKSTDAFHETSLQDELLSLGVSQLIVAGARTEYCVDTTCRRAVTLGFNVTLVSDGHTTADGAIPAEMVIKHHNHHLSNVKTIDHEITVMPAAQIVFL
ncbi:cysteine hydrolase family protein [Bacillus sp. 1P10SD]|uniref:cysteine hydrolase family protein n=1 Tax=Bacillus sp. 1P10SD TaxID=3132265 RepID=UPI0039A57592